ncbi:MAG: PIN domain-containing protein [Oceanipulchritudo sp.]
MSAEYFLDTNVLVYSFDDAAPAKRDAARNLMAMALRQGTGVISWQVVQEFLNVALHKWEKPMSPGDASDYLSGTLEPLCGVFPSPMLWRTALSLQAQSQYRFYDCLIVAAALQSGAKILYSEDLQAGRQFAGLEIRSPFE